MKINLKIFCTCSIFAIIAGMGISNAAVTARQTPANTAAANRAQNRTPSTTTRMPTAVTETATTIMAEPEPVDTTPVAEPDPILEPVIIVDNKTSIFSDVLSEIGASATDSSNSALAETIRRQRALLDAKSNTDATTTGGSGITTANACDAALRKCMTEKCGNDFTKCASDSTTAWGNKMDSCRRNTKCTGHEYSLLAPEILADRNAATELSYYNSVVNCGNRYNDCMFNICGKSLEKCLSKSAGDGAVAKCKSIADECREQDSGLAARIMDVMADNRKIAAADAQKDEKRLYELRDLMRTQCTRFGAMFDDRTLDCVYTVNFFAGDDNTLMASKKLYSGDTFQCTPDWFGVDITTYIENAQRLTRSQKSASAAAFGAGVGTLAGLASSGAIGRAWDTQNAEKQAKEACTNDGGEWVSAGFNKGNKCDMTNAKENCTKMNGKWDGEKCVKDNNSGVQSNGGSGNGNSNPYENKNSNSPTGGDNQRKESDFKRQDAKGNEPTDEELEKDKTGRTCRKYYTEKWCAEYYALYNKEKEEKKAATEEQRKQRRQKILDKFNEAKEKVSTGISNVKDKISGIFTKDDQAPTVTDEQKKETQQISQEINAIINERSSNDPNPATGTKKK